MIVACATIVNLGKAVRTAMRAKRCRGQRPKLELRKGELVKETNWQNPVVKIPARPVQNELAQPEGSNN